MGNDATSYLEPPHSWFHFIIQPFKFSLPISRPGKHTTTAPSINTGASGLVNGVMEGPNLDQHEIIKFLTLKGGRCTNFELVSNFRGALNHPQYQGRSPCLPTTWHRSTGVSIRLKTSDTWPATYRVPRPFTFSPRVHVPYYMTWHMSHNRLLREGGSY